ncbi:hypothetical protein C5167_031579 [Papaver somniferum]|uniref:Uncharacterized protein n=1 Tax=Papaver somniferum TaxID=3469 RepID=A0A4Y7K7M8_PAPSO|nr:hypothetical protein C5167_031579 [Papaver somniferum]
MVARSRVTRSGRLNPDSESGKVIDVPFHGDVVNQSLQTHANPHVVNESLQTPANPPVVVSLFPDDIVSNGWVICYFQSVILSSDMCFIIIKNPGKEKEPQELPMCDIATMMVKRAKWIGRALRRNIEEVLYLDCEEQRKLILRLLELYNLMRDDLYTDEVIDDWISLSQTPDSSSSSSEDVPSIVGRSG